MKSNLIQRLQSIAFNLAECADHKTHAHQRKACDNTDCQYDVARLNTIDEAVAALQERPRRRHNDIG